MTPRAFLALNESSTDVGAGDERGGEECPKVYLKGAEQTR